jgi:hypothetical protein
MTLIETKTLGAAAASIEFTSIPQDGTDLVLLMSGRTTRTNALDWIQMEFNTITSDYSMRGLFGNGSATGSFTETKIFLPIGGNTATANTFGNSTFYIPNYTGSTNKSVSGDGVSENNATGVNSVSDYIIAGLWSNTAAITSIKLFPFTAAEDFVAGSTVSLYKVTKGSDGIVTTS